MAHPPDYVKHVTITAPDGSVFTLDPAKDWLVIDQAYYKNFLATDFKSGAIPSGNYKATVVPTVGNAVYDLDNISVQYLTVPTIKYPVANQPGVPARPTFSWTSVGSAGVVYYRVQLWNISADEPVFFSYQQ